MSAVAQSLDFAEPFNVFAGTSSAASDDAKRISEMRARILIDFANSATGNQRLAEPLQTLAETFRECQQPNWDGEGAEPISAQALSDGQAILSSLPSYVPLPEIFPEPTGAIAFAWYRAPGYRYVIAVSGKGVLQYSGLFGAGNDSYGESRLQGGIPKMTRDHLRMLFTGQIHAV